MAFGIDDIAIAAVSESLEMAAETSEVLESAIGDFSLQDFNETAFSSDRFAPELSVESEKTKISEEEISVSNSTTKIEQEFNPENFNNNDTGEINNLSSESTVTIERTSTLEDQTIDNFELESKRTEIEDKMILGQEHDGSILRYNLEQAIGTKSDTEVSNAHHLVGRDTPQAAKKLEELGIDRNDPANGIFLPNSHESPLKGAIHGQGRHSLDYSNEVEQRFSGVTTREEALEVLQSLKEDLHFGELNVHRDISPNK